MESKEKVVVKIVTDTSELDEACAKAERLKNCLLLQRAEFGVS